MDPYMLLELLSAADSSLVIKLPAAGGCCAPVFPPTIKRVLEELFPFPIIIM